MLKDLAISINFSNGRLTIESLKGRRRFHSFADPDVLGSGARTVTVAALDNRSTYVLVSNPNRRDRQIEGQIDIPSKADFATGMAALAQLPDADVFVKQGKQLILHNA